MSWSSFCHSSCRVHRDSASQGRAHVSKSHQTQMSNLCKSVLKTSVAFFFFLLHSEKKENWENPTDMIVWQFTELWVCLYAHTSSWFFLNALKKPFYVIISFYKASLCWHLRSQTLVPWKVAHDGIKDTVSFGLLLMYSPLPRVKSRWKIYPDWCISGHETSAWMRPCNWATLVTFLHSEVWDLHFFGISGGWISLNTAHVVFWEDELSRRERVKKLFQFRPPVSFLYAWIG